MLYRWIAVIAALLLNGCATITGSELQSVSLSAQTGTGEAVTQATCDLKNDKGAWKATPPGFVQIRRSAEDLLVACRKDGLPDGYLRAVSRAHGGMFGNIVFGGGVGAIIDHSKGTGYDYPNTLRVRMGTSVVVDRRDETNPPDAQSTDRPKPQ